MLSISHPAEFDLGFGGICSRTDMSSEAGGDEMASVKNYFNTEGFGRWQKIYGETDVSAHQLSLC